MALPAGRYGVTKEQLRKIKRLPINTIGMITETKEGIAIIEDGAKASQLITAGRQFWHNGKLYSADVDIAKDADIITSGEGKNATEMPNITDQLPGTDAEKANEVTIARVENGSNPTVTINAGEQFYHSGILYTATADIATTDTITPNTNCRVSDSVTGQIADRMTYADNSILGAKNLYDLKAVTQTVQGITYTPNLEDGTITVSGTVEGSFASYVTISNRVLPAGRYVINGSENVTNISYNTLELRNGDTLVRQIASGTSIFNGFEFEILDTDVYDNIHITYKRSTSGSASGTIKPMIRRADDTDPTFQPYAQTNRELTVNKADTTIIGTVEDGTTASQAYSANDLFIRSGKIGKATTSIAQGEPLTLGTNYTETTIGAILTGLLNA